MSTTTPAPTAPVRPKELWNTMPGWGIVANLTPPELIASRKLRVVRRFLVVALLIVVLMLAGVYAWSWHQRGQAQDELTAAQDRTTSLTASENQFQAGVRVQSNIDAIDHSLASLMATDVDTASLIGDVRAQLPSDMSIGRIALTLDKNSTDSAGNGNVAGVLDNQPDAHIGTITLSGTAASIGLVSTYVDRLGSVSGIVQPYPASVSVAARSVVWSITLTVNAKRFTHTYDVTKNGGN